MEQPNVLFFMCDQMQYQRQGRIDPIAHTPNLDRLGNDGVFCTHFYTANGQCVPSRVSMQTGLYPHEAEVMIIYGFHGHTAHLTGEQKTVGHVFRDAGYDTAYFGKTHFGTSLKSLGYDFGSTARSTNRPLSTGDREIVVSALDFLGDFDSENPLFLTVSVHMPHPPFELVGQFADNYTLDEMEIPGSYYNDDTSSKPQFLQDHVLEPFEEGDLRDDMRKYYSMISEVDRMFGQVRSALEKKGMWDNTLAVFTSDHGDMMGAHRMTRKGTIPYEEIYRIPMIVRLPGNELAGRTEDSLGVNVSLPGTLIDGAGLTVPESFRGGSLMPILRGERDGPDEIFYEHYGAHWGIHPLRVVRSKDWKYVKYFGDDDTEELYHLKEDPLELRNLVGDPTAEAMRVKMEASVDRWWLETGGKDAMYYESEEFRNRGGDIKAIQDSDVV